MTIPVHVLARSARDELDALLAARPAGERWAVISDGLLPEPLRNEGEGAGLASFVVAGCVCCVGNLALNVTLTRVLQRTRPARIVILVGDAAHLESTRAAVMAPAFAGHLHLAGALDGPPASFMPEA